MGEALNRKTKIDSEINTMVKTEKKVFLAIIIKETMVDRSLGSTGFSKSKREKFKQAIEVAVNKLTDSVDRNKIKNRDIRKQIMLVCKKTGASVGQAQKVINTYLKFYCFISDKRKALKELDCPLDSTTMNRKQKMKDVKKKDYGRYQEAFEAKHGLRILEDLEYDRKRIKETFGN